MIGERQFRDVKGYYMKSTRTTNVMLFENVLCYILCNVSMTKYSVDNKEKKLKMALEM